MLSHTEETDEDDEDENSEESIEDDSKEDLTETPKTFSTRLPYSLIPPPPLWVQRNQGLSKRTWFLNHLYISYGNNITYSMVIPSLAVIIHASQSFEIHL